MDDGGWGTGGTTVRVTRRGDVAYGREAASGVDTRPKALAHSGGDVFRHVHCDKRARSRARNTLGTKGPFVRIIAVNGHSRSPDAQHVITDYTCPVVIGTAVRSARCSAFPIYLDIKLYNACYKDAFGTKAPRVNELHLMLLRAHAPPLSAPFCLTSSAPPFLHLMTLT